MNERKLFSKAAAEGRPSRRRTGPPAEPIVTDDDARFMFNAFFSGKWSNVEREGEGAADALARVAARTNPPKETPSPTPKKKAALAALRKQIEAMRIRLKELDK